MNRSNNHLSGSDSSQWATAAPGFSFVELLMVVAVISILAAMAVPHLQRIRMNSQERVAIACLRTAYDAQLMYHNQFQRFGALSELISAGLMDDSFSDGEKSGYDYRVTTANSERFVLVALPLAVGVTGTRGFYVDEMGVIRFTDDGSAPTATSSAWTTN